MDSGVFLGRVPPGHLSARPFRAGDGAGRHVDEFTVQPMRADVDDARRGNVLREVPAGDQSRHLLTIGGSGDLIRGEHTVEDHRPLDAPVERQPTVFVARRADQNLPGADGLRQLDLVSRCCGWPIGPPHLQRLLADDGLPGSRIIGEPDAVPSAD